jgi:Rrf2 family protein
MLSKRAKYALKALIVLAAEPPGQPVRIQDLARRERIPQKFLETILLDLKNHGILQSKKGKGRVLPGRDPRRGAGFAGS